MKNFPYLPNPWPLKECPILFFFKISLTETTASLDLHSIEVIPFSFVPFDKVPLDLATDYAAEDADITLRLYETLEPKLNAIKPLQKLILLIWNFLLPHIMSLNHLILVQTIVLEI